MLSGGEEFVCLPRVPERVDVTNYIEFADGEVIPENGATEMVHKKTTTLGGGGMYAGSPIGTDVYLRVAMYKNGSCVMEDVPLTCDNPVQKKHLTGNFTECALQDAEHPKASTTHLFDRTSFVYVTGPYQYGGKGPGILIEAQPFVPGERGGEQTFPIARYFYSNERLRQLVERFAAANRYNLTPPKQS